MSVWMVRAKLQTESQAAKGVRPQWQRSNGRLFGVEKWAAKPSPPPCGDFVAPAPKARNVWGLCGGCGNQNHLLQGRCTACQEVKTLGAAPVRHSLALPLLQRGEPSLRELLLAEG